MTRTRRLSYSVSLALAAVAFAPSALADGEPPPLPSAQPGAWSLPRPARVQAAPGTTPTLTPASTTTTPTPTPTSTPTPTPTATSTPTTNGPWALSDSDQARRAQSIKLSLEAAQNANGGTASAPVPDRSQEEPKPKSPDESKFLHGFRIGYSHTFNYDKPVAQLGDGSGRPCNDPQAPGACVSLKDKVGLKVPDHLLLGYEVIYRVVGQSWLNVLMVGNVNLAGLEQSKVMPTGNLLLGFELNSSFQVGVGANLAPLKGSEAHAIVAAGWTPKVGTLYAPLHVFFIPDADGVHRMGVTTGVTF
jgi:hypothetical protein